MKSCAVLLSLVLLFVLFAPLALAYSVPDDTIVYVTPDGTKYHRESCTYIKDKRAALTIEEAEDRGYEACSRCHPDELTGEYVSKWDGRSGGSAGHSSNTERNVVDDPVTEGFEAVERSVPEPAEAPSDRSIPEEPAARQSEEAEADKTFWQKYGLFIVLAGPFAALSVASGVASTVEKRRDAARKAELPVLYSGKSLDDIAPVPEGVSFDTADGLPKSEGPGRWGSAFTFYVTHSGTRYHSRRNCGRNYYYEIHAVNLGTRTPCRLCRPIKPDLSWYYERKRIRGECAKYGIDI